jgi:hypothetical protein
MTDKMTDIVERLRAILNNAEADVERLRAQIEWLQNALEATISEPTYQWRAQSKS